MKKSIKKAIKNIGLGGCIGIVNGMFGAGGGMLAVPILKHSGLDRKQAHANAVAVILPITVLSAGLYIFKDYVTVKQSLAYIPAGIAGSVIGTLIIKKISPVWLKRIFGAFMVYAGVRLLFR